jgi:glycosyltransferase involved in cell wall biosynthesis
MESKAKKKLVVLLSRVPARLDKGDKLRAFNQLKYLANDFDVYLLCLDTEKENHNLEPLLTICKEVKVFRINKFSIFFNLVKTLFSNKPFQVGYFKNSSIRKEIKVYIKKIEPDHIYAQLIRTTEYVKDIHNIPKTLDFMDAFSKGIERRINDANIFLKPLYKNEYKRLLKYESLIFEYFEHKTIISDIDREYIFHIDKNQINIVSNGIDDEYFDDSDKSLNDKNILFTGNMSYPPNIKAAEFIIHDLAPKLKDYHFTIAGANPVSSILSEGNKQITITGWIDDIKQEYKKGKIFIAPMFIGTGVQNKLLEAMAMGIPCITTSLANKPLKAIPDNQILIADTVEEFLSQIKRLETQANLFDEIAKNAKIFVKENYSWGKSSSELVRIMTN